MFFFASTSLQTDLTRRNTSQRADATVSSPVVVDDILNNASKRLAPARRRRPRALKQCIGEYFRLLSESELFCIIPSEQSSACGTHEQTDLAARPAREPRSAFLPLGVFCPAVAGTLFESRPEAMPGADEDAIMRIDDAEPSQAAAHGYKVCKHLQTITIGIFNLLLN